MAQAIPCPCGRCNYWLVEPQAAFQGVSFTEREARAVADLLNKMKEAPWYQGAVHVVVPVQLPKGVEWLEDGKMAK